MKRKKKSADSESDEEIWSYCSGKRSKLDNANQKDKENESSIIAHSSRLEVGSVVVDCAPSCSLSTLNTKKTKGAKRNQTLSKKTERKRTVKKTSEKDEPSPHSCKSAKTPKSKQNKTKPAKAKQGSTPSTSSSKPDKDAGSSFKLREKHSGNCPFCQMPFCALTIESPRWHTMECMDLPILAKEECPAGVNCDCTIPSHYRRYTHTLLANLRAGTQAEPCKELQIESVSRKLDFPSKPHEQDGGPQANIISPVSCRALPDNQGENCEDSNTDICVSPYFRKSKPRVTAGRNFVAQKKKIESENEYCSSVSSSPCLVSGVSMFKDSQESLLTSRVLSPTKPAGLPFGAILTKPPDLKSYPTRKMLNDRMEAFKAELENNSCPSDEDIFASGKEEDQGEDNNDVFIALVNQETPQQPSCSSTACEASTALELDDQSNLSQLLAEPFDDDDDDDCDGGATGTMAPPVQSTPAIQQSTSKTLAKSKTPAKATPHKKTATPQSKKKSKYPWAVSKVESKDNNGLKKQTSIQSFFKCVNTRAKTQRGDGDGSKVGDPKPSTSTAGPFLKAATTATGQGNSTSASVSQLTGDTSQKPAPKPWPLRNNATSKAGYNSASGYSSTDSSVPGSDNKDAPKGQWGKKKCPFYKKIPGTGFVVDAFQYGDIPGVSCYFLSHFHYDHYGGLRKSFAHPLYCSQITANLVEKKIKVQSKYMRPLPMNKPVIIEGTEVTFLEANHCPGSVLLLFKLRDGRVILHTGDFRACEDMENYPQLQGLKFDQLYLDTTYCDPAYAFPPQRDVINIAVNIATDFMHQHPNGLVVVGSYTIGKERIFMAVADALDCKICVTREKKGILDCLENDVLARRITLHAKEAKVHVLPMRQLNYTDLQGYLAKLKPQFDHILSFEPTGWTHSRKVLSLANIRPQVNKNGLTLYGIPYSEHSSYEELRRFVQFTRPLQILPTVNNGNPSSRKKMEALFKEWLNATPKKLMKQSALNSWLGSK